MRPLRELAFLSLAAGLAEAICRMQLEKQFCNSNVTCYVGLPLPPYIIVEEGSEVIGSGFDCSDYRRKGLDGAIFELLGDIWRATGSRCYIAPPNCSVNEVADIIEDHGGVVGLGPFMELPGRLDQSLQWVERSLLRSTPLFERHLVVVGSSAVDGPAHISNDSWGRIVSPFHLGEWVGVTVILALMYLAAFLLKYSRPSGKFDSRPRGLRAYLSEHVLDSGTKALHFLFTRLVSLGVEDDEESGAFPSVSHAQNESHRPQGLDAQWRVGLHKLIRMLLGGTVSLFLVVLLIFYQAALTTHLFNEDFVLPIPLADLRDHDLGAYVVPRNSDTSAAWLEVQRRSTRGFKAWKECPDTDTCFDEVLESASKRFIVQEDVAKYVIKQRKLCSKLAFLKTDEPLVKFSAGLVYGSEVPKNLQRELDIQILKNRLSGELDDIVYKYIPESEDVCLVNNNKINWKMYLIPTAIVFGSLTVVIMALICLLLQRRNLRKSTDSSLLFRKLMLRAN